MKTEKICRECPMAFIETSKDGRDMARQGYKSCSAAHTPLEKGMYVRGDTKCLWPERVK